MRDHDKSAESSDLKLQIGRLERSNQIWRRAAILLLLFIGCSVLIAGTTGESKARFLETEELRIVDREGNLRIQADAKEGASIVLYDQGKIARIILMQEPEGAVLGIIGKDQVQRISLGVGPGLSRLSITNTQGERREWPEQE